MNDITFNEAAEQAADEASQIMRIREILFLVETGNANADNAEELRAYIRFLGAPL